jgi:hypothetical protein
MKPLHDIFPFGPVRLELRWPTFGAQDHVIANFYMFLDMKPLHDIFPFGPVRLELRWPTFGAQEATMRAQRFLDVRFEKPRRP